MELNKLKQPNTQQWQVIMNNDSHFDRQFWYGVTTTKIFCKSSCPPRPPIYNNIVIFTAPEQASAADFRPCKRYRPFNQIVNNQIWVNEVEQV